MHPTLTWTIHASQPITAVGANATIDEVLASIKDAVDTAAAGSGRFEVADYNATNGTLVLRRKGSPSGELGTMRIILFGKAMPHASALRGGAGAAAATNLYMAMVIDPTSPTAPDASYTAGSPYPGKKYTRANGCGGGGTIINTGKVVLFDADEAFGFAIHGNNVAHFGYAGKLVHRITDDTLLWASFGSGNYTYDNTTGAEGVASAAPVPTQQGSYSLGGTYWDGASARCCTRMNTGVQLTGMDPYGAAGAVVLVPVLLGDCAQAASQTPAFLGFLRQMRLGPKAVIGSYLRDSLGVLQARHISASEGTPGFGVWLDNVQ